MGSLREVEARDDEAGFLATRVDALLNWGRKNSLWPMPLGLSCCGIELMAMIGPKFDIARFGAEAARFSPRQCDLMIVAGTLTWKMAEAARTIYDQMPDPKWVIAMGVCSSSGGMSPASMTSMISLMSSGLARNWPALVISLRLTLPFIFSPPWHLTQCLAKIGCSFC